MRLQQFMRMGLAIALAGLIVAGSVVASSAYGAGARIRVTAYFANSNGIFVGDDVRILGVRVGRIDRIEPQPLRVKIQFSVERRYPVPAQAMAAILSPTLVTARAIQLTPGYTSGPVMPDNGVIPQERTVVPVEWDDVRIQIQKLAETLQPDETGVSTLGSLINTAADNLRGQGDNIRDTVINLSRAMSLLNDHSTDIFSTVRNLSVLVSALHDSSDLLGQLNQNLSAATALLADDPDEIGSALQDFNRAASDAADFLAANRDTVAMTSDKVTALSQLITESLDDIKQTLHTAPNTLANFNNVYSPAQASLSSVAAFPYFSNPISLICGLIQSASRLNSEQAAKLCVQYLAPIVKNRQYNFPPLGTAIGLAAPIPVVGALARPNEVTYSESWMRPDYVPPPNAQAPSPTLPAEVSADQFSSTSEQSAVPTDPKNGLPGMMIPPGPGS